MKYEICAMLIVLIELRRQVLNIQDLKTHCVNYEYFKHVVNLLNHLRVPIH